MRASPARGMLTGAMLAAAFRHARRHSVGYVALFVALGGVSYAAIPDGSGVVHGCYDTSNQTNGASPLYVIDTSSTSSCPQGRSGPMTALNWNGKGPTGPPGPQGPKGPTGPPGRGGTLGEPPSYLSPTVIKVSKKGKITHFGGFTGDTKGKGTVRCIKKFPTALTGGFTITEREPGTAKYVDATQSLLDFGIVFQLYNQRVPSYRRYSPEGWTAAVALAFPGDGKEFVQDNKFRVWALCGKKKFAKLLGVPLVPPH